MDKISILIVFIFVIQPHSPEHVTVDIIPVTPTFNVGFGGVWDERNDSTYFVDHYTNSCYRYSWLEKKMYRATVETNFTISFIFPSAQAANIFFVGAGNTIILAKWDGSADTAKFIKLVCVVEPNTGNIMNHAGVGPQGEFIFGLFSPQLCSANATQGLYQYKNYKTHSIVKPLLTDMKITSGVAIDEECHVLYHLDGCLQELTAYDYNSVALSNKRMVMKFNFEITSLMVGLVIDRNGWLYTGLYGSSFLVWIFPKTRKFRLIEMPTEFIGDPGFSGRNLDLLLVASGTAIPDFSTGQLNRTLETPPAGNVLIVKGLGVRSRPIRLPYL